jgi:VanZ family protein
MLEALRHLGRRSLVRWIPALAWMALIFYLSAQQSLPRLLDTLGALQSLAGHLVEYAVLALLLRWALDGVGVSNATAWALLLAMVYALTDEFHQYFVPGRKMDPLDLLTDAVGAAVALWLAGIVASRRAVRRQN